MAYGKGDLKLVLGACHGQISKDSDVWCEHEPECPDVPMDARGDYEKVVPVAFLPHSCDSWVIGGPPEIRALISDLSEALKLMGEP